MKTNYLKQGIRIGIPMILIAMLAVLTTRCSDELTSDSQEEVLTFGESPILQFNNSEDFTAKAQKTVGLTLEELRAEEAAEGYLSFGRIADEIYEQALAADFSSLAELEAFVEENNDYLQLIVDENGEKEFVTQFYNNPFRYVMNKDRMFQVEGKAFKQFENGIASVAIQDIDALMEINTFSYEAKNSNIEFTLDKKTSVQKKTYANKNAMNCGDHAIQIITNGSHRTKVEIAVVNQELNPGSVNINGYWLVRPQRKRFGIWWNVKKYIRGYVNMAVDYSFGVGWNTADIITSVDAYNAFKWEGYSGIAIGQAPAQSHFDGYFAFGDTGSTSPAAEVQCNKSTVCVGPGPVFPSLCPEANPAPPAGGGTGGGNGGGNDGCLECEPEHEL